jgi:hypothetical protein
MANAAVINRDLHLVGAQLTGIVFIGFEFPAGLVGCIRFNH